MESPSFQGPFIASKRAILDEELPVHSISHWHALGQKEKKQFKTAGDTNY